MIAPLQREFPNALRRYAGRAHDLRELIERCTAPVGPAFAKSDEMQANEARTQLLAEHERIRRQLEICTRLAVALRSGQAVTHELDEALEQLRTTFVEHNDTETTVIQQLLHGPAAWGSLLVDRMFEEHVAEHAAIWERMSGPDGEIAQRIDDLVEELDAHMAAEERTFLSSMTLRDDVLRVRTREEALE